MNSISIGSLQRQARQVFNRQHRTDSDLLGVCLSGVLPCRLPIDIESSIAICTAVSWAMAGAAAKDKKTAPNFAGVRHGQTIGAPIALRIENRDWQNWEKILAVEAYPKMIPPPKSWSRRGPGTPTSPVHKKFNFHDARYIFGNGPSHGRNRSASRGRRLARLYCGRSERKSPPHDTSRTHAHRAVPGAGKKFSRSRMIWNAPALCRRHRPGENEGRIDAVLKPATPSAAVFEIVAHHVPVGLALARAMGRKLDGRIAQAVMSSKQ